MKISVCIIFLIGISCCRVFGQSAASINRVQLYQTIINTKADSGKLHWLNKLGRYYCSRYAALRRQPDLDSTFVVFRAAIKYSEMLRLDTGYGKYESLKWLGNTYLIAKDTGKARYYIMQNIRYYSLHQQLRKVRKTWLSYGDAAYRANFTSLSFQCYQRALAVPGLDKFPADEIAIRFSIAIENDNLNNETQALNEYMAIVNKFKDKHQNLDRVYLQLAHYYRYKGDLRKALAYALAGVNDMEAFKDDYGPDNYYAELALTYDALDQTENSLIYYRKTFIEREHQPQSEESTLRTLGFIIKGLIKLHKLKDALNEVNTLEIKRPAKTDIGKALIAQNKAYCYETLKSYDNAEKYYLETIKYYELAGGDNEALLLAKCDVASFYIARKQYAKAQKYLHDIAKPYPSPDFSKKIYLLSFKIDSGMGNYRSAINNYMNYQQIKDSLFGEAKSKEIEELQIKYETDRKEKDIALLRQDSQLQHERANQANKARNYTFIGIFLLLIIIGLLYNSFRINQKKTTEINLKNTSLNLLVAEKDELLEEKEWLMKEIHHRVKNNLQIVMGLLQRQSSFISNKDALAAIRNSEYRMHAISLIHQKLYQTEGLMMVSMVDYIDEMVGYLCDSFDLGTCIQFKKQIDPINIEVNMAVPLALILNEAVTNAIKYAFPTQEEARICISLTQTAKDEYKLQIADNGKGLPLGFDSKKTNSMGFGLIRGLSKQVGGDLSVISDGGVSINIKFRLNQPIV